MAEAHTKNCFVTHKVSERFWDFESVNCASTSIWRVSLQKIPPIESFLVGIREDWPCRWAARAFRGCARWISIQRTWIDVTPVCLGDGQTEAEGVPSQGGRGDTPFRCVPA